MANSSNGRSRLQNAMAYSIAALIGLSILSILAIMVLTVFFPNTAVITILVSFPWLALPASALLIIALLILQIRSKGKDSN
jgi:amino acid transporter